MNDYMSVNILDLIKIIGEDNVNQLLSDFLCPKNPEIENFIRKNALDFAKRKISVTHLILNRNDNLDAIFVLTHKAVKIRDAALSSTLKRKIKRYAQFDETTGSYMVSAFLIAQLGKNYKERETGSVQGNDLMDSAMSVLSTVQHEIGGGVVYLECEDKPQLLSFYQNANNCFRVFGERFSDIDNTKYIQLLRFF